MIFPLLNDPSSVKEGFEVEDWSCFIRSALHEIADSYNTFLDSLPIPHSFEDSLSSISP